jgi:perosamine synthetase
LFPPLRTSPVNAIAQTGATPIFVDSCIDDWLLDPRDVARRIGPRTKAIMAVHLYGAICDMAALGELARRNGIVIVEDCAEALGCTVNGQHVGTFGVVGTFSFYGNKTITTGEGGMVVTKDPDLAARLRLLKGQAQSPTRRYWHEELGFNYRMTNICAALGLAQLERLSSIAIETRPAFCCAHRMPMYAAHLNLPAAEQISRRGISLPSYPQMSDDDVARVAHALCAAIRKA